MTDLGRFEEIDAETPYAGIERRVLNTAKATVQEYRFEPGATFPLHHHPQEQITLVLKQASGSTIPRRRSGERADVVWSASDCMII